jgi:hypothetical protein
VELRTSLNAVEKRTIPLSQSSRHFTDWAIVAPCELYFSWCICYSMALREL